MISIFKNDILDNSKIINDIVSSLKRGELVIYPTETIYGIGGIDTIDVNIKLSDAKLRKPNTPFIRIGHSLEIFINYQFDITPVVSKIADKFWPGNLTIILFSQKMNENIAIRVSDHPFVKKITQLINKPLLSTSANLSNTDYVEDLEIMEESFSEVASTIINWGELPSSQPSTVISIIDDNITYIREGVIPFSKIEALID